MKTEKIENKIATSVWFDLLGVAIVVTLSGLSGYFTEMLNATPLFKNYNWAAFIPFGIISTISSIMSLMSTRLTGRLSKVGNYIGIIQVVIAGMIDAALGNKGAWLSYPVSFFIYAYAIKFWSKHQENKVTKPLKGIKAVFVIAILILTGMSFSLLVNYIGWGASQTVFSQLLFWLTTATFAISLVANLLNAVKLTVQWQFWGIYNVVQLAKAIVQGNWANCGKYIYYIINAIACHSFWAKAPKSRKSNKIEVNKKVLSN